MRHVPILLLSAAALVFPYAVHRVFLSTPIEAEMGTAQKIFYFHVPLAWICMAFALACGVAAGIQLRRGSSRAEAVAIAAGELTVLAGLGVLLTGPIWGDATWGTPWTGDARQTATALLWLIFVAYLLVLRYGPPNADRLAAALAIFGAIDVPLIYWAVRIWKTTHPSNTVVASLPPAMWASLWPCLFALLAASLGLFAVRVRQARLDEDLDRAWTLVERSTSGAPR
jgi:heme exporter protein C